VRHGRGGVFLANYRRVISGVSTVIFLTRQLCKIQLKYGPKIIDWISTHTSSGDYATFLTWYNAINVVCQILEAMPDD